MLGQMRELAKPAFRLQIKALHPHWNHGRVDKLVAECESAYASLLEEAKDSSFKPLAADLFADVFPPAFLCPLGLTLNYWRWTYLSEAIYTEEDFTFTGDDIVDSETLFEYLKTLPSIFRNSAYKKIGLSPVLISRFERSLRNGDLNGFEHLLLTSGSDATMFSRFFGRMNHLAPIVNPEDYVALDGKDRWELFSLLSTDEIEQIKRIRRETRHLPILEQVMAINHYYIEQATLWVKKYYHWRRYMDEDCQEIISGIICNPIFPGLKDHIDSLISDEQQVVMEEQPVDVVPEVTETKTERQDEVQGIGGNSFRLPRDERWKSSGFFHSSSNANYIMTTLGGARNVTQEQIESLFNILVNVGCLDNTEETLLVLAIRLTGRKLMEEPIPPIEWLGEQSELDYLIYRLTPGNQTPEYSRYKTFYKDYNPNGAGRRTATGKVRESVISSLNEILPPKQRPEV